MRAHSVYSAFERRWQLPVYFQMRWKEIVTKLEDSLSSTRVEPTSGKGIVLQLTSSRPHLIMFKAVLLS